MCIPESKSVVGASAVGSVEGEKELSDGGETAGELAAGPSAASGVGNSYYIIL